MRDDIEYRGYRIRYEYCIGYAWNHKDIDVDDLRHGFSRTLDEAKADIGLSDFQGCKLSRADPLSNPTPRLTG